MGLSAGKTYYSLHICAADKGGYLAEQNAAKLGKVKTGRSGINFKKLEDLKLDAVIALVKQAVKSGGFNAAGWPASRFSAGPERSWSGIRTGRQVSWSGYAVSRMLIRPMPKREDRPAGPGLRRQNQDLGKPD